ncbi:helix-turn-helix domain-containing protein [Streptomyces sp. 2231.1]|uniref:helix-turn-helix domain-containing protein n=1 Tax=Streptomyces sp. 2231.1 TaxID=1855347 RepID=UPI00352521ED
MELADYLRKGRDRKGLTYSELASRAGDYSATTFQQAASGRFLPSREVARAYAHACALDIARVDRLWEIAYREKRRVARGPLPPALPPHLVSNLDDLSGALVALHAKNGAPSIRLMLKRARQHASECTPLSTSALHRILSRATVPTSRNSLQAFLIGCDVPTHQRQRWERAAARARRHHRKKTELASQAMAQLEQQVVGDTGEDVSPPERANQLLRAANLDPTEPYRGFTATWTVRCLKCRGVQRVKLAAVAQGRAQCPICGERNTRTSWEHGGGCLGARRQHARPRARSSHQRSGPGRDRWW